MTNYDVQRPLRRWLTALLFVLAGFTGGLYLLLAVPLSEGRELWRSGRAPEAVTLLQQWSGLRLRPADFDHLLAVSHLSAGDQAAAGEILQRISSRRPDLFPFLRKEEVMRQLAEAAHFPELLLYDQATAKWPDTPQIRLYRSAALVADGNAREASGEMEQIDQAAVDATKLARLRQSIEALKKNVSPLLLDREGRTLVTVTGEGSWRSIDPTFTPVFEKTYGEQTLEALSSPARGVILQTTLHPRIQEAATAALSGHRGAIVVLDPDSGQILAMASSSGEGVAENLVFRNDFEAGSVIKVLTGLEAEESESIQLASRFPSTCRGYTTIDGRQFLDWAKHGELESLGDAMAVSCNVAFGELGVALGIDGVKRMFRTAGFGGSADLHLANVPLGRIEGPIDHRYAAALAAIGLEYPRINSLHLAMLASMMANGGVLSTPTLIQSRSTLLGDVLREQDQTAGAERRIASPEAVAVVVEAMKAVIANARGTGKRAEVPGLEIAMKTGTAGDARNGYNALVMAFAPVAKPRWAVGIILEDSGPAQYAGAEVTRDLFTRLQNIK